MKSAGNQPRLLTAVMEAIACLRDGKGSTQRKILSQVNSILSSKNCTVKNAKIQILKALKHGVKSGLIKQKSGKFKLGLDARDYAIFKKFQQMGKGTDLPVREYNKREVKRRSKKRRRRRRRGSRRRGRKYKDEDDISDNASASKSSLGSQSEPEPADRSRRRRRRRRRRGKRRNDEKEESDTPKNSESKEITPKSSTDENVERVRSERSIEEERNKDRREQDIENKDDIETGCGNSQCLCNVKQETEDRGIYGVDSCDSFGHY